MMLSGKSNIIANALLNQKKAIVSIPKIDKDNPYQFLFYSELKKYGFSIAEDFIFTLKGIWENRYKVGIFHFHWLKPSSRIKGILDPIKLLVKLISIRILGKKIVWTAHNFMPHETNNYVIEYMKRLILSNLSSVIIVHSSEASSMLEKFYFVHPKKILIIKHGLYTSYYPSILNSEQARNEIGLSYDSEIFLYFGRIRKYKNIEVLISSFKKTNIKNIFLLLVGPIDDGNYWVKLKRSIGSFNNIKFITGYIPTNKVSIYFQASDCVILPYKNILTSGVAMLSATFKKPIIMKRCGFSEEYFNEENAILLDEVNEASISQGIEQYLIKKEKFKFTNEYMQQYEWANIIKDLVPVLSKHLKIAL